MSFWGWAIIIGAGWLSCAASFVAGATWAGRRRDDEEDAASVQAMCADFEEHRRAGAA